MTENVVHRARSAVEKAKNAVREAEAALQAARLTLLANERLLADLLAQNATAPTELPSPLIQQLPETMPVSLRNPGGRFRVRYANEEARLAARKQSYARYKRKVRSKKFAEILPASTQINAIDAADPTGALPPDFETNEPCLVCDINFKQSKNRLCNEDRGGRKWWRCQICARAIMEICMPESAQARAALFVCVTCREAPVDALGNPILS